MRFGSTAKLPAKRVLQYYRISCYVGKLLQAPFGMHQRRASRQQKQGHCEGTLPLCRCDDVKPVDLNGEEANDTG